MSQNRRLSLIGLSLIEDFMSSVLPTGSMSESKGQGLSGASTLLALGLLGILRIPECVVDLISAYSFPINVKTAPYLIWAG